MFRWAAPLAVVAALFVGPGPAEAQAGDALAPLAGEYRLITTSVARYESAVERTVAAMNFVARPIARRRLLSVNAPAERMSLQATKDSLIVTRSNQPELRAPRTGAAFPWRNAREETLQVRVVAPTFRSDTVLVTERYVATDGERENRWVFNDASRRVTIHVTVRSPQLPRDLVFRLDYERVGAADSGAP